MLIKTETKLFKILKKEKKMTQDKKTLDDTLILYTAWDENKNENENEYTTNKYKYTITLLDSSTRNSKILVTDDIGIESAISFENKIIYTKSFYKNRKERCSFLEKRKQALISLNPKHNNFEILLIENEISFMVPFKNKIAYVTEKYENENTTFALNLFDPKFSFCENLILSEKRIFAISEFENKIIYSGNSTTNTGCDLTLLDPEFSNTSDAIILPNEQTLRIDSISTYKDKIIYASFENLIFLDPKTKKSEIILEIKNADIRNVKLFQDQILFSCNFNKKKSMYYDLILLNPETGCYNILERKKGQVNTIMPVSKKQFGYLLEDN